MVYPQFFDLRARVEEALPRYGVAGRVSWAKGRLRLSGHGPTIEIAVPHEVLPDDVTLAERQKLVERLARQLAAERRAAGSSLGRGWGSRLFAALRLSVALGLGVLGLGMAWHWLGRPATQVGSGTAELGNPSTISKAPPLPMRSGASDPLAERCQLTRTRIAMGGNVTPLDVDGWVVEFLFITQGQTLTPTAPRVQRYFPGITTSQPAPLIWPAAEELSRLADPHSPFSVAAERTAGLVPFQGTGIRLTASGSYIAAYFDETRRPEMQRLAAALCDGLAADWGALYARCAHDDIRQVGSWFRGKDVAGALTSLVAAMRPATGPTDPLGPGSGATSGQLMDVQSRFARADRRSVGLLLGREGGMLAERRDGASTLSFPFRDANRATRASQLVLAASRKKP